MAAQLLLVAIAWSYRQPYPASVVAVVACTTPVMVLHPATTGALTDPATGLPGS